MLYLRTDCLDPTTEVACNNDYDPPGNLGSRLLVDIGPGTYSLFVDGQSNNFGDYWLAVDFYPATGDACADAIPIIPEGRQMLAGTTAGAGSDYQGSCAGGTDAPDRVYIFDLSMPTNFEAETHGYDTVLYLRSDCAVAESEVACNDDIDLPGGNYPSRLYLPELDPGSYVLVVDGYDASSVGDYRLTVAFESAAMFADGFEPGDTSAWSATVP